MTMPKVMSGWVVGLVATVVVGKGAAAERPGESRAAPPSADAASAVNAVDMFCEGLVPMTKVKERRRLFGLFQKGQYDRGQWVEFKSQGELDVAVKAWHVYDVAQVWSREDEASAVSLSLTSGSGDWVQYVEYCFRADGTLARAHSTLNTFNAVDKDEFKDVNGASRVRDRYFNGSGRQVKVSRQLIDLKTKLPAPTLQIQDADEPIYKTTVALPFYRLWKGRGAAQPGVAPDGASPRR